MGKKLLQATLMAALTSACSNQYIDSQSVQPEKAQVFESYVETIMNETSLPGLAVTVIDNGKIVSQRAYGYANVDSGRAMTIDTPMNIASISKPILGIGLLQLKDQGLLDFDKDINSYLPFKIDNPHTDGEKITIRHLATHTSSIADFYLESDYTEGKDSPIPLVEHVKGLLIPKGVRYDAGKHYLTTMPGTEREYSNLAAGLAGVIAEEVSGETLNTMMTKSLFEPLGMNHTSWIIGSYKEGELATRYKFEDCASHDKFCNTAYPHLGNPNYPDGGINASLSDLTILTLSILSEDFHRKNGLLTENSFEEMLELQLPETVSSRQRFFWRDRNGMTGHMGSDLGVATSLYFNRASGDAIIVLFNRDFDKVTGAAMKEIAEYAQQSIMLP